MRGKGRKSLTTQCGGGGVGGGERAHKYKIYREVNGVTDLLAP